MRKNIGVVLLRSLYFSKSVISIPVGLQDFLLLDLQLDQIKFIEYIDVRREHVQLAVERCGVLHDSPC